ncbi:hypothetical protein LPJ53_003544 [Coemansia erecta]|uniref:Uncharacterized protein n=1 Tax=Coemansia erecta TaxID=147472 RepID=A0A9W7Y146_9FUNG|nr:hypothetical protein LPJ53_003544 [Coemansia erecta]
MANDTWCSNVLQNEYMQGITSMAWQPNSGYTLAVGCTTGVCLWSIIPSANVTPSPDNPLSAPSLGEMQFSSWMTLMASPPLDTQFKYPSQLSNAEKTPFGRRLVVGFDDDSASSDVSLLAVYLVCNDALFRAGGDSTALMPLGFIRGPNWGKQYPHDGDISSLSNHPGRQEKTSKKKRVRLGLPVPSWFGFAPNFEPGALLTVAWANGKVSFYPMLFK